MENQLKVLLVNASEKFGGVSSVLYNYYINMKSDTINFTFLSPRRTSFEIKKNEISANGDIVSELGANGKGILYYFNVSKKFKIFLENNNFDIIHINSGLLFYNAMISVLAKKNSKSVVIVHSHSSGSYKGLKKILSFFAKKIITDYSDYYFACSDKAAYNMFSKKIINDGRVRIINNAINVKKFKYNAIEREKIRNELNISDECIVIGNVSRLTPVKNHNYMLKIVKTMKNDNADVKLLLIGSGELEEELKNSVHKMQLDNNVIFLGMKDDVFRYYSSIDVFILPSFYEGLPLSGIEAQSNGLRCIFSTNVSRESDVSGLVKFLDINDDNVNEWCTEIKNFKNVDRADYERIVKNSGYDIKIEAKKMLDFYKKIANGDENE